jgi:protein disulfide-isomerase
MLEVCEMKKLTFLVVLLMAVVLVMPIYAEETEAVEETAVKATEVEWLTDFAAAKKMALEKNIPILIDFSGSDWCGWCVKLDKEVFGEKSFKDYAAKELVLFMADYPRAKPQTEAVKAQNQELMKKFGVRGFPTILLIDAEGKELGRTGYQAGGPDKYVEHLKELLKKK